MIKIDDYTSTNYPIGINDCTRTKHPIKHTDKKQDMDIQIYATYVTQMYYIPFKKYESCILNTEFKTLRRGWYNPRTINLIKNMAKQHIKLNIRNQLPYKIREVADVCVI